MRIPPFKAPLLHVMGSFSIRLEKHQCRVTFDLRDSYLGTPIEKLTKLIEITYPDYTLVRVVEIDKGYKYSFTLA